MVMIAGGLNLSLGPPPNSGLWAGKERGEMQWPTLLWGRWSIRRKRHLGGDAFPNPIDPQASCPFSLDGGPGKQCP